MTKSTESKAGWQSAPSLILTLASRHSSDTFAARASWKRMSARGGRSRHWPAHTARGWVQGTPETVEETVAALKLLDEKTEAVCKGFPRSSDADLLLGRQKS